MTKIKNFRITLRPREILRALRHQTQAAATPELEASVEQAVAEARPRLQTAAVYTTLTRSTVEKTVSLPLTDQTVAVSLLAVTVGPGLVPQSAAADAVPADISLWTAVQEEALQQASQFALRLLGDQAKEEECEMSAAEAVQDPSQLGTLGTLLGVQRIGIEWTGDPPHLPPYARMAWTRWTPLGKGGRKPDSTRPARITA